MTGTDAVILFFVMCFTEVYQMNLSIDELQHGIRQQADRTGYAPSPMSSFAVQKGAGAGRVQDVISVELGSSAFGTDAYAGKSGGDLPGVEDSEKMQRNRHNAMALLSNTLSGEDYAKAMEDGFDPGDTEPGETVTITDRIKTVLASSGKEITGFNDDMDLSMLEEITGSPAMAQALANSFSKNDIPADKETIREVSDAVKMASDLTDPADAAIKYMTENRLDPTIRNFYLAENAAASGNESARGYYSDGNGYYAKKAEDVDLAKLEPQIDAVLESAGLDGDAAKERAGWMIENSIPLTPDSIKRVMDITGVEFPVDLQLAADAAVSAVSDGLPASSGNLADPVSIRSRASELMWRQELEEARLYMSTEVNVRLLEKGVKIDTLPMEELIDELKAAREEIAKELFPEAAGNKEGAGYASDGTAIYNASLEVSELSAVGRYGLFEASIRQTAVISAAPAAFVAAKQELLERGDLYDIAKSAGSFAGRSGAVSAALAVNTYEAVGTQVRSDLGDSIKKAFGNVDDILRELGMETSEDNRRAVRILGYNSMEITRASVENVRGQDVRLKDVTDRLKPAAVLSLIRDGKNPLAMTLDELKQELDRRGGDERGRQEKYSKFLYKLEKAEGITPEERESYIGIYRLFNTLEKTGHAAIGALLEQKADMTIGNLLTATRSAKTARRGIDRRVDDDFGGLDGGYKTPSISEQISSAFTYYAGRAHSAYEHMDPEKLHALGPDEETGLTDLADAMEAGLPAREGDYASAQMNTMAERAYANEQAARIRHELSGSEAEEAAEELILNGIPATPDFIGALRALRTSRRRTDSVWDALAKLSSKRADKDVQEEAMKAVEEALSDGEHFEQIYKDRTQEMMEDLDLMMEDAGTYVDLETMIMMNRQLTVATRSADRGSYDIPVELEGERVNLHVTLKESRGEGSLMKASVPTSEYGVLTLSVSVREGKAAGTLNTSEAESAREVSFLGAVRDRFAKAAGDILGNASSAEDINLIYRVGEGKEMDALPGEETDSETLFGLAKAFVEAIRYTI